MNDDFVKNLPAKFVRNVTGLCGATGEKWLAALPQTIAEIENLWSLKVSAPYPNLSYNFVALCVSDGGEAVLKIALPLDDPEIFNEAKFLQLTNGSGAVKLLNADKNHRALLLEKAAPGANLKEIFQHDADKAVAVAVGVLHEMLKPVPKDSSFVKLETWFGNFFRKAAPTEFPPAYLNMTQTIVEELSCVEKFLLHGDLHHENILAATREPFLIIDPKGIVGNVGYEIAVFLNNHRWWLHGQPDLREKLNRAVAEFSAAFEIPAPDLKRWAFAQIVLSAWWTFEENNENWKRELAFAEIWEV